MTDPTPDPDPQPQPVTGAAHLAGLVSAAFTAIAGLVFWFKDGGFTAKSIEQTGTMLALSLTAVLAVASYVITLLHGKNAADLVTPLSSPRDDDGNRLVPETAGDTSPSMGPDLPVTGPDTGTFRAQLDRDFEEFWASRRHHDDTQEMPVSEPEIPAATDDPQRRIPERVVPGKRLGRHVRHDPRSLSYLVPPTTTPVTAMWTRRVPVFDQGNLGSCTGNAAAGVLGTDPFYATLPAGLVDDEQEAVNLYSTATSLDDYSGSYPPDDTGSDGLSVAKACQRAGLISGYQHITSVAGAQTAIKSGPFLVGTDWLTDMDSPDTNGLVHAKGSVRGGHEYECFGYDADADLWWFWNSWGTGWGRNGAFCYSSADFAKLLAQSGDATVFLPASAPFPPAPPAPAPTPPGPTPAPSGFPVDKYEAFEQHRYSRPKMDAFIAACDAWLAGR